MQSIVPEKMRIVGDLEQAYANPGLRWRCARESCRFAFAQSF